MDVEVSPNNLAIKTKLQQINLYPSHLTGCVQEGFLEDCDRSVWTLLRPVPWQGHQLYLTGRCETLLRVSHGRLLSSFFTFAYVLGEQGVLGVCFIIHFS